MNYVDFLGVKIIDIPVNNFVDHIFKLLNQHKTVNIMSMNLTAIRRFDKEMEHYTKTFDFVTADGNGLVKLSGFLGERIENNIFITGLSGKLIEYAHTNNLKVYLLGGKEQINEKAQNNLRKKYPALTCYGRHGYFDEKQMDEIIAEIKTIKPHIILAGISSPKKERAIINIKNEYTGSINVACGGYIDILAGEVKDAPMFIRKLGLAWIYRFIQEPIRLFRPMLIDGFYFLFYVFPKALFYKKVLKKDITLLALLNR